jgi:hypothetical protein
MRDDCLDSRHGMGHGMVDVDRSEAEPLSRRSVGLHYRRRDPPPQTGAMVRCVPGYTMDATARDL